jgi:hypothetical protein
LQKRGNRSRRVRNASLVECHDPQHRSPERCVAHLIREGTKSRGELMAATRALDRDPYQRDSGALLSLCLPSLRRRFGRGSFRCSKRPHRKPPARNRPQCRPSRRGMSGFRPTPLSRHLDSEQFRLALRTCRRVGARLKVRRTDWEGEKPSCQAYDGANSSCLVAAWLPHGRLRQGRSSRRCR